MDIREYLLPSRNKADNYRRSKQVLILLFSSAVFALICLFIYIGLMLFTHIKGLEQYNLIVFICSGAILIAVPVIALINRFLSSYISAISFLLLLFIIIIIFNTPHNIINGYGLFWFSIPVVFASFILFPSASFIMAALSSCVLLVISLSTTATPNFMAIIGFFVVASIAFLSVKSMNDTVKKMEKMTKKLQKELESQKKKHKITLEENKAKNHFISNITHEIRTPMSAILGISKYLNDHHSENLTVDQKEGLAMIYQSCKKLLLLVTEVLELSKIEAGKAEAVYNHFAINDLIAELKENINNMIEQKPLIIYFQVDSELPDKIFSDRKKLFQVLFTVMNSIVKYIEKGEIIFHTYQSEKRINFSIRTAEIMIPTEQLMHIFSEQVSGSSGISELYAGIGLGINLCRRIIKLLNGGMEINTEYNKEIFILIYLPLDFIPDNASSGKQLQ